MIAATAPISTPSVDLWAIAPILALVAAGVSVVLVRALLRRHEAVGPVCFGVSLLGVAVAAGLLVHQWHLARDDGPLTSLADMVRVDPFAVFLGIVVVAATAAGLMLSYAYVRRNDFEGPEYFALVLLAASGMLMMTTANDLVVVFVSLEVLSIPLYVLAAFDKRRLRSQEAGLKYFVLGAFSSAVFLYGIALTYGATGTTSLTGIATFLSQNTLFEQSTLLVGLGLLLVGLGFKVAAVPFHMWTPDVYQGAPTPVTAFMATATKAAAFGAILRIVTTAFPQYRDDWRPIVWVLAALSMLVGAIVALAQNDIKRTLAYSSIAHAGYILMGVYATTSRGREAALLYLLVYAFMAIGAFAVVMIATPSPDDASHSYDDYRGMALRRPVLGGLLIFFVLAQAGVPLTSGFIGKLEIFGAVAQAGETRDYVLLVVGVISAVIAFGFYLRIAYTLVTAPEDEGALEAAYARPRRVDGWTGVVLLAAAALTLVIGVAPGTFIHFARDAIFF
ncbi:MAG: NADH-quinone oxidoreductase subunit N [Actinomycetota bacterium]